MLEAIERMRKLLSANSDSPINIECLMEDEDFYALYKREDFEKLIEPMTF